MDASLIVVGIGGLLAMVWKFTDFLKMLTNLKTEKSGVVTQLEVWAAAVFGVFLFSATQFGPTAVIGDISVDAMSNATKLWVGLAIGSLASGVVDFKQARDNNDSAKKPPLIPPGS